MHYELVFQFRVNLNDERTSIPPRELQRAFTEFVKQSDVPSAVPSSESLKIRCAIADYILNSQEGSLEERLLEFVAAVPLDV